MFNRVFFLPKICCYVLIFVFVSQFSSEVFSQVSAEEVMGIWLNGEKSGKIKIYKSGNTYNGKIDWLRIPKYPDTGKTKVDRNNPDEQKRKVPLIGLEVLKNFRYEGGEFVDGTIYDPKSGKTYTCKMWFGETKDELKIRGYWGLFFRTETWTRSSGRD